MSKPHLVLPGQVISTSRQVLHRHFRLRPDRQMVELFKYLLALYAAKYGIKIHVCCLMSTHYHLVFTDVHGNRGEFFRDFHSMLTKCVLVYRGLRGTYVFDKSQTSQCDCINEAVIEAVAYALANPTAAGITSTPSEWPGNFCHADELATGKTERVKRPDTFRREDGSHVRFFDLASERWPEEVELRFEPVPMLADAAEYQRLVQVELEGLIRKKLEEAGGQPFSRVRQASAAPSTTRPAKTSPSASASPASRPAEARRPRASRPSTDLREFWALHAEAVANFKKGDEVVFPPGTYRWAKVFGFPVAT
ncbi:MAG: hypothetical protein KF901_18285 [Myxococcales bacterium]|nr:hypothetical protein [Myxococcales bacterium]